MKHCSGSHETFLARLKTGDRRAVARAISIVEAGGGEARALQQALPVPSAPAWRVGLTGPPGAGKSTLTAALAERFAAAGQRVAVLAVDPSSPFTSGALLGDRVRMAGAAANDNIFVRSMATRGAQGGLSAAADNVIDLFEACAFDIILVESVGVGQQDIDIRSAVDTTLVLLVPESGDYIQTIKAGVMEVGDIYVVNKSDRPRSDAMLAAVRGSLVHQQHVDPEWQPLSIGVSALNGDGCDELLAALEQHRTYLAKDERLESRRYASVASRLRRVLRGSLERDLIACLPAGAIAAGVDTIQSGQSSLFNVASALIEQYRTTLND